MREVMRRPCGLCPEVFHAQGSVEHPSTPACTHASWPRAPLSQRPSSLTSLKVVEAESGAGQVDPILQHLHPRSQRG
jgi:hypothetical protein